MYLSDELLEATVYQVEQIKSVATFLILQEPIPTWTICLWVSLQYCIALQPRKIFFIHLPMQDDQNLT